MKTNVPRCMSTQHPDNVTMPFFADGEILAGEAEVKEAFYVFSQLRIMEQMWDSEGKEADSQVVEKLLSRYTDFFKKNLLGKKLFLTYRVPNPSVEKEQGKILLETLNSIPRAYDVASLINKDVAPVFEVILPMTTTHLELERVRSYYEKIIIGQKDVSVGDVRLGEWVGDFGPEKINVIPLLEDRESFQNCASIVEQYIEKKDLEYQRVFLARSDPALNYGSVPAVLLAKSALHSLHELEKRTGVKILPILGVGSAPFRGNFAPDKVDNCCEEYPSVQTFTVQSSFKYDHPFRDVVNAVDILNHSRRAPPHSIDRKEVEKFVDKIKQKYQKEVSLLADTINALAPFIPPRRARKLHIGLFGYARSLRGIRLPRAIKLCATLYSIGIPPELLGLGALSEKEFDRLHELYIRIDQDLKNAVSFINRKNISRMPPLVKNSISKALSFIDVDEDPEYCDITSNLYSNLMKGKTNLLSEDIKAAAWKRKFLG